ncbi:MAG: M15 family metallopeptidase [Syntrophothermus sp.]
MKIILFTLFLIINSFPPSQKDVIVDANYTFNEALANSRIPDNIKNNLTLLDVEYYSFDNRLHQGQLVINKVLVRDIKQIFTLIKESKFPVNKVIPIVKYNWSDDASMLDNNTSAFQYRKVANTKVISKHSFGRCIDINPFLNPFIKNGKVSPKDAKYNVDAPGTLSNDSPIVKEFKKLGWKWGGNWRSSKDYQHFEK